MCIRDRNKSPRADFPVYADGSHEGEQKPLQLISDEALKRSCLLYTSDAADERSSVDLGGRRIIKKKNSVGEGGGGVYR